MNQKFDCIPYHCISYLLLKKQYKADNEKNRGIEFELILSYSGLRKSVQMNLILIVSLIKHKIFSKSYHNLISKENDCLFS
jgi:hypothetical protein